MKRIARITALLAVMTMGFTLKTYSEESTLEKAETTKDKVVDSVKSSYRKTDDKVCETVNGKENCVSKKIKNKLKNTSDKVKTNTTEVINKID